MPAGGTVLTSADTGFRSLNLGDDSAFIYTTAANGWDFEFAAAQYSSSDGATHPRPLQVGLYKNATRYPFNSPQSPGLNVDGMNRGYDMLSAWFDVYQISYDTNFEVLSLAVDFEEYGSTNQTGPGLYGSLRFNSDIPVNVPEPSTYALMTAGLGLILIARRRSGASGIDRE